MAWMINSNQLEIDEALAVSLLYDHTIDDAVIARQFQQQEEDNPQISISDDEKYASSLQEKEYYPHISVSDDEKYANLLQEEEYMAKNLALTDHVSQITHQFQDLEVNGSTYLHRDSSQYQQSCHSLPTNVDLDPQNMTYEELTELGESIGNVSKGLSKRRISQIPTHTYGAASWFKMKNHASEKSFEETECSICLLKFKKGDTISTLPCAHIYHQECISLWLEENKICGVCNSEIEP